MNSGQNDFNYDVVVIGSGPAGQKAAIQAAKAGRKVALIERNTSLGGACVHKGTIPSKTLRENALRINFLRRNAKLANFTIPEEVEMNILINRLDSVLTAHDHYMGHQLKRNNIEIIIGKARFISPHEVQLTQVNGKTLRIHAHHYIIATGSIPRAPDDIPIDHEHILDSDSILSLIYLPKSLTVLGGGVIASEYASIFAALGVQVTMIDKYPRPLGFLDEDLTNLFVTGFIENGGQFWGNTEIAKVYWDGISQVVIECMDGRRIQSEKLLCAAGRIANISDLNIEEAGIQLTNRGLIEVNAQLCTSMPHIYAAGDVIGPPSLASASMEQGRRASCNALGIPLGSLSQLIPTGIYAIPELSSIGISERQAREEQDSIIVGYADFKEVARGQINDTYNGMLKIVCDGNGRKILGIMIVGEGATELIHIGQLAMLHNSEIDTFVDNIFNFPTLAEAYRVAALSIIGQRSHKH